jgi:hypothetical protein
MNSDLDELVSLAQWRDIVADAVQAPSSHNTQPWQFHVDGHAIELMADRTRSLPVNDPHDRELTISCAAALFNVRVSIAYLGFACSVALQPDNTGPDVLARVDVHRGVADPRLAALHHFLTRRRTARVPFDDAPLGDDLVVDLSDATRAEGCRLVPMNDPSLRASLLELIAEGDRLQFDDMGWRRELASWMHPRRSGDGLTVAALALPATRLVVSRFNIGERTAEHDIDLGNHAPLMAVLTSPVDGRVDWMAAGQALQRALLVAASSGAQASYLNQPCQVQALRPRLAALLPGQGVPQLVLRIGFPAERTEVAPRRPVDGVLVR